MSRFFEYWRLARFLTSGKIFNVFSEVPTTAEFFNWGQDDGSMHKLRHNKATSVAMWRPPLWSQDVQIEENTYITFWILCGFHMILCGCHIFLCVFYMIVYVFRMISYSFCMVECDVHLILYGYHYYDYHYSYYSSCYHYYCLYLL